LKEKIKLEKLGNNPEITKANAEKESLKAQRDPIQKEIADIEAKLKVPREQLLNFKAEKDSLTKELEIPNLEKLNAEISSIQQRLGFSRIGASEEKKLIERKAKLESQKPKVQKLANIQAQIKKINESNNELFNKLKTLKESNYNFNMKLKTLGEKISNFMETKKANDPNIKNLELQKESISKEMDACYKKKREINNEYEDKLYNFKDQQRLLKYIKDAQDKIAELKKREEKEKKRKEREAKLKAENEAIETAETTAKVDEEPFAYEMWVCEWLASYFKNQIGAKETVQSSTQEVKQVKTNSKIDEDISKGVLKVFSKNDDDDVFGLKDAPKKEKKTKGPKVSKREQKVENSNVIALDISIIKKISDIKLSPPSLKSQIPVFINLLEKTLNEFKLQAEKAKAVNDEVKANAENSKEAPKENTKSPTKSPVKAPVEVSKSSPVKNEVHHAEHNEEYEEIEITEEIEEEVEEDK
jgi:hypothetical protein